jgi:hypothetical protein
LNAWSKNALEQVVIHPWWTEHIQSLLIQLTKWTPYTCIRYFGECNCPPGKLLVLLPKLSTHG